MPKGPTKADLGQQLIDSNVEIDRLRTATHAAVRDAKEWKDQAMRAEVVLADGRRSIAQQLSVSHCINPVDTSEDHHCQDVRYLQYLLAELWAHEH